MCMSYSLSLSQDMETFKTVFEANLLTWLENQPNDYMCQIEKINV